MAIIPVLTKNGSQPKTAQIATSSAKIVPVMTRAKPLVTLKPTVSKPKPISKPKPDLISQGTEFITKVSKAPVIGKTLQFAKDVAIETGKYAKQTAIDLENVFKAPFRDISAQIKIQFNEKDRKELEKIQKSKLSLEEKIAKASKILEKYGGQTKEQSKSAERGSEFGMSFTKPGGFVPEAGAVTGNIKFILKQGIGKIKGEEQLAKIVGKEINPEEVLNKVINSPLEKTPDGKGLIKTALDAKKQGKNVIVEVKPKVPKPKPNAEAGLYDTGKAVDILSQKATTAHDATLRTLAADINSGRKTVAEVDKMISNKYPDLLNRRVVQQPLSDVKPVVKSIEQKPVPIVKVEAKPPIPEKVGKTPSKIGTSIERKAIEARLTKGFEGVAGYDKITIKEQSAKAHTLMQDLEKARRVIRGEEELPKGLRGTALITATEEHIAKTGDAKMVYELANSPLVSETSAAAQELRLAAERQPDSLALKLRELRQVRKEAFEKKFTGKNAEDITRKYIEKGKAKIAPPKLNDWGSIIREVRC